MGAEKICNAENKEECRETQRSKLAERNSLNAEAQRGETQPNRRRQHGSQKMEAKRGGAALLTARQVQSRKGGNGFNLRQAGHLLVTSAGLSLWPQIPKTSEALRLCFLAPLG